MLRPLRGSLASSAALVPVESEKTVFDETFRCTNHKETVDRLQEFR